MSREPRGAQAAMVKTPAETPAETTGDPTLLLQDAVRPVMTSSTTIFVARADGGVWIDLQAERDRIRVLEELFNAGLGRTPDSTRALIDQTTATPKVTKVWEAAQRMAERLGARGFEIVRRV